jgi:hypothetical protein
LPQPWVRGILKRMGARLNGARPSGRSVNMQPHGRISSRLGFGGLEWQQPKGQPTIWGLTLALILTIVLAVALYGVAAG